MITNKDEIFQEALEILELHRFSCNALKHTIRHGRDHVVGEEVVFANLYREMFGFGDYDHCRIDPFIWAINNHADESDVERFDFRVLLLSLAQVAWDDVFPKEGDGNDTTTNSLKL